jgi:EAL domain-containing protein (putative c-di-GMP-specific phosphodiesterase class I)
MIAESVENEAVLDRLDTYGCDLGQGYHLSGPQDAAALTPWPHRSEALAAAGGARMHR